VKSSFRLSRQCVGYVMRDARLMSGRLGPRAAFPAFWLLLRMLAMWACVRAGTVSG